MTPDRLELTLHEPVVLRFSVENTFAEALTLDLGWNRVGKFTVAIFRPDGLAAHPAHLRTGGVSRTPRVLLATGERYSQQLLLNEWYPFDELGDYRIEIEFEGSIRRGPGTTLQGPPPREIALRVGPRDPAVLAETCQRLIKRAVGPDAESALGAAKELSYVLDGTAVPFLARLTREGPFVAVTRPIALRGLNRIAAAEGVGAVVSRLDARDRDLAPLITGQISTPTD
ncbi:MAG TPA: hypothetical protein VG206_12435 [Terriglobia bacterium]|nr:hypothetical protein [Terriglobia bacterium]